MATVFSFVRQRAKNILRAAGYTFHRIDPSAEAMVLNGWSVKRLLYFKRLLDLVRGIPGDVVECGVGAGVTFFMLSALTALEGSSRNVWGFDSFAGFPEPTREDASPRDSHKGEWNLSISEEDILSMLRTRGIPADFIGTHVKLVKGFFKDSLPSFSGTLVALLHLDVDLYQSYKDTLEYFWPRVQVGGVVLFDEYKQPGVESVFPGAAKAIDEFFGSQQKLIQYDESIKRYYIIKN
jgi:hypothetical protein